MKSIIFSVLCVLFLFQTASAQTPTPTPTLPSSPGNYGSWWGCFVFREYSAGSWSSWSSFVCSPSAIGQWSSSIDVVSAGGDGLRQKESRFSFHPPNGVSAFTLLCSLDQLKSAVNPSSAGAQINTTQNSQIIPIDGFNLSNDLDNVIVFPGWGSGSTTAEITVWYQHANALPVSQSSSPPQIKQFVNANGVGSLTATSTNSFLCEVQYFNYGPVTHQWYSTPTPLPTATPGATATSAATPTPGGGFGYEPLDYEPLDWISSPVTYTASVGSSSCYTISPELDYGTYSIGGYTLDLSFEGVEVCASELSFGLQWGGIDFSAYLILLVFIGAFSIIYSRMG